MGLMPDLFARNVFTTRVYNALISRALMQPRGPRNSSILQRNVARRLFSLDDSISKRNIEVQAFLRAALRRIVRKER